MADLHTSIQFELEGQAALTAGLREIENTIKSLKEAFASFSKSAHDGVDLRKTTSQFFKLYEVVADVGTQIKETSAKAETFGSTIKSSANEATRSVQALDSAIKSVKGDMGRGFGGTFGTGPGSSRATRERVTIEARARRVTRSANDFDFSTWKAAQRIKSTTLAREARAAREGERAVARADKEHLRGIVSSNRAAAKGRADAIRIRSHARHQIASGAHGAVSSMERGRGAPAVAAAIGVGVVAEAAKHFMGATEKFDDALTRYAMFAVAAGKDTKSEVARVRKEAQNDSIKYGANSADIVDIKSNAARAGIASSIIDSLPKTLIPAAHLMAGGGDGDIAESSRKLSETIQQSWGMGWIKTADEARKAINIETGLSNYGGNSPVKTEQFIANGGLGYGNEMGLDFNKTMAMMGLLNSSGEKTGTASARVLEKLSGAASTMADKHRRAVKSRDNSEETRATRRAPRELGYSGIEEMRQELTSGAVGYAKFGERMQQLPDKERRLIMKGYSIPESAGASLNEVSVTKAKGFEDRAKELSSQTEGNDYLTEKFTAWQKGLVYMLDAVQKGFQAVEAEIGDVIKDDIVAPFQQWWTELTLAIVDSDLKTKLHQAIQGFFKGLGFEDMAGMLQAITRNFGTFDFVGFATGIGEGLRNVASGVKLLFGAMSFGDGHAETIGKLGVELFAITAASIVLAPVIGVLTAFVAALKLAAGVGELSGITAGLKAIVGLETGAAATGLMSIAAGLGALSVAVQGLLDLGILSKATLIPKSTSKGDVDEWLWGKGKDGTSARPAWAGGAGASTRPNGFRQRRNGLLNRESFEGEGGYGNLLQNASWDGGGIRNDGSSDQIKGSLIGTEKAVVGILDAITRGSSFATKASLIGGTSFGDSSSGFGAGHSVSGGGTSNMRYGHGSSGAYRGTLGTGGYGTPSKSLLDFIAQSEGGGYDTSQGNGKYLPGGKEQNLTGKSLNEILALGKGMIAKSGSSAMGRYQITGGTIRDLMGRMHLSGTEKYDEKMQDAMASKLIADEGPRALNRWEGLKRGGRMATARGLLGSGSIASIPSTGTGIMGGGGNVGAAVDHAMSLQGAGEAATAKALGKHMSSGQWCADFVNGVFAKNGVQGTGSSMANSFNKWGRLVDPHAPRKGDVITENRGGNSPTHHVGIATGEVHRGKDGVVDAIGMISGNYGHQVRHNMERLGIVQGLHRGVEDGPAASRLPPANQTTPGGGEVHHHAAPTIHVNGTGDPHVVAGLVAHELHRHQQGRLSDRVAVV